MHAAGKKVSLHIAYNLPLTSVYLFAPVQSAVLKDARRESDTLAVQADQGRRSPATGGQPVGPINGCVEPLPQVVELPATK
ncbi:hypothetical protein EAH73_21340 [Hymenobacter nivis]|uniref:Uncharacterized protein n=1 Tax=Hymenobacter nivis TaxID=1850093 RepID=A0A502GDR1_9BACT|nr:hypothetical protein EAH73_21340 [Hymenobacter nivis]